MNELEIWFLFGKKRASSLARELGCSRQNIRKDTLMTDKVLQAINKVEQREMLCLDSCATNILRAAELTSHEDDRVRNRAYFKLVVWSEIYGELIK